jgi:hypothetical protein
MGTYEIGELSGIMPFCWGRSLKIHIEIKRGLLTQKRERERERTNAYPAIINKSLLLLLLASWHIHSRVMLWGIKPISRRH